MMPESVRLRPLRHEDLAAVSAWNRKEEIRALMGHSVPADLDIEAWWRALGATAGRLAFGIVLAGDLIGEAELEHISWRALDAEVRICIGYSQFWSQGFGTEALACLLAHAFDDLKLNRLYLRVLENNGRAIRSYEKLGFAKRARLTATGRLSGGTGLLLMELTGEQFHRQPRGTYGQSVKARSAAAGSTAEA